MNTNDAIRQVREQAMKRGQHARAAALKRKEEFLGARVPRELRDKVIRRAEELGVPVSILIRSILEDAFSGQPGRAGSTQFTPGATIAEEGAFATQMRNSGTKIANVIGWETVTLNQDRPCVRCGKPMRAGEQAIIGLCAAGQDPVVLCNPCKAVL
jgi:hypothetical protein